MVSKLTYWLEGSSCCNQRWEDAYNRFESKAEEISKFQKRLSFLGAKNWKRDATVVDLFCGSGRNLACLESMGFSNLHGVDLSPRLLNRYSGSAKLYVGDATNLNFPDQWADIVIVQGGLHHLPKLPDHLKKCFDQIHRVLKPNGLFVMVEPWLTPFLAFTHLCCKIRLLRILYSKLDSLAIMIEEEEETYFNWLSIPGAIEEVIHAQFKMKILSKQHGKLLFVGNPI
jgi:ubiquinone/menaquinone biosynthesis C-methylase UbiE